MNQLRPSLLLLTLYCLSAPTQAVEILQWQRLPLAIPLQVGQERVVFVDQNMRVGIPQSLKEKLRIQSNGGAIYLRANEPIEPTRLQLQDVNTGEIILIDIAATASDGASAFEPVKIVKAESSPSETNATRDDVQAKPAPRETPLPVVLTRYAAQSLYAPLRTIEPLEGVRQVRVDRNLDLSSLLPTLPLHASMLGAWQLDDFWVTAVRLQNQSSTRVELDPRALQGDFIGAAFQHQSLDQNGTAADTTTLYLVTRGNGLAAAILPAMSAIDAASNLPTPVRSRHEK